MALGEPDTPPEPDGNGAASEGSCILTRLLWVPLVAHIYYFGFIEKLSSFNTAVEFKMQLVSFECYPAV